MAQTMTCTAGRAQLQAARRSAVAGVRLPGAPARSAALVRPARPSAVVVRAERSSGGFLSGFVVGGVIFGVLGFVFAPQISKALLGDEDRLRLPRFMEEEEDPEVTKANLADKIAQLNAAIDDVSNQLKANDVAGSKDDVLATKST